MLKKFFIIFVAIVIIFSVIVSMQPSEFKVERSITIAAAAPTVFAQVNDFRHWAQWSPWEKIDPAMKKSFEGAPLGVGAIYSWVGNNEIGEGRMTITESMGSELIRIKLEFIKPFTATNDTLFTFKSEGNQTVVTWTMSGKNNFMAKAIGLFMNCEKMVGDQFEKGLAQLKSLVETTSTMRR